ncbi:MAG: glycosyltransferase [Erysipelotrichaceae bacterium]
MKIVQINSVCDWGSTGKLAADIARAVVANEDESLICFGRNDNSSGLHTYRITSKWEVQLHGIQARLSDGMGLFSKHATKKLVRTLQEYQPDIIHLHNLHGYYLNYPILFEYLKTYPGKVIWTLHDCWSFTGHCAYYSYAGCEKWRSGCGKCPQLASYPKSLGYDRSAQNYKEKQALFTAVDMTLVTPSKWLNEQVQQSFLNKQDCLTIYNGIDLDKFAQPKPVNAELLKRIGQRKILLGVATVWIEPKGIHEFEKLADLISEEYVVVLVGKLYAPIRNNKIIHVAQTADIHELAGLYAAAHVFVNPTLQEVLGLTNIEALACGTSVITYASGGSVECVDSTCGLVVNEKTPAALWEAIQSLESRQFSKEACYAKAQAFSKEQMTKQYLALYQR